MSNQNWFLISIFPGCQKITLWFFDVIKIPANRTVWWDICQNNLDLHNFSSESFFEVFLLYWNIGLSLAHYYHYYYLRSLHIMSKYIWHVCIFSEYRLLRRFRPVKNLGHGLIWPSHVGTAQRKEKLLCYENIGQAKSKLLFWPYTIPKVHILSIK